MDTTYRIGRLARGGVMRVSARVCTPGGKGNNVARILRALGHDVVASGFVGGQAGAFIEGELKALGIEPEFVAVAGESRTCLAIVEDTSPAVTELLEPGPTVTSGSEQALLELVDVLATDADAVVLSGSLPDGARVDLYADLVRLARDRGAFVALDSSGAPLAEGLVAEPDLVKPNWAEMCALMGRSPGGVSAAVSFVQRRLIGAVLGVGSRVLLSLGRDGAILIGADDAVGLPALSVSAVNTVGAGDAMVAGYLDAWSRGERTAAALARASAVAAASTLQRDAGTIDAADVARLLSLADRTVAFTPSTSESQAPAVEVQTKPSGKQVSKTYSEIRQQPEVWESVLATATAQSAWIAERVTVTEDTQLLFVGSGTSFYLAQAAAQTAQEVTGLTAHAVCSADVFLSPGSSVPVGVPLLVFLISRSGRTSEALLAAQLLMSQRPQATVVALSCVAGSPLSARAHYAIELEVIREESVVMTQSFTGILLALQVVAATIASDEKLREQLDRLPSRAAAGMQDSEDFARRLGADDTLSNFVYLGVGSYFALAQEASLKLTEMTQTRCAAYNSLEFRHGPISTVQRGTAAVLLGAKRDSAHIDALVRDLAGYGAFVAQIAPPRAGAGADQVLSVPSELDDVARSLLYMPALQLIAYHRATALGLDPDAPRNLERVVVLDHESAHTP